MAVWLSMSLSQGTPNETTRTNTVTASVKVHYSGGSYNGNSPSGTLTIDGQSFNFTCNFNYAGIGQGAASTGTGSVTAATRTVTVSYGSSTTKTVSASASFNSGTASGTVTASDSISLTSISAGGSSGGGGDDGGEEWDPDNPGSGSGSDGPTANAGNCTNVEQTCFYRETERLTYDQIATLHVGNDSFFAYVGIIKFTTPDFSGVSTSLDVNLSTKGWSGEANRPMRYALCTSDYNHNNYLRATADVYDPNQIVRGSMVLIDYSSPFTIQTDKLKGNTEYYLIFWISPPVVAGESSGFIAEAAPYHGIAVNYTYGVVHIDTGTGFDKYTCYIDNGTDWELAIPYIDDGTNWKKL